MVRKSPGNIRLWLLLSTTFAVYYGEHHLTLSLSGSMFIISCEKIVYNKKVSKLITSIYQFWSTESPESLDTRFAEGIKVTLIYVAIPSTPD